MCTGILVCIISYHIMLCHIIISCEAPGAARSPRPWGLPDAQIRSLHTYTRIHTCIHIGHMHTHRYTDTHRFTHTHTNKHINNKTDRQTYSLTPSLRHTLARSLARLHKERGGESGRGFVEAARELCEVGRPHSQAHGEFPGKLESRNLSRDSILYNTTLYNTILYYTILYYIYYTMMPRWTAGSWSRARRRLRLSRRRLRRVTRPPRCPRCREPRAPRAAKPPDISYYIISYYVVLCT